jgi:hypothetical protein
MDHRQRENIATVQWNRSAHSRSIEGIFGGECCVSAFHSSGAETERFDIHAEISYETGVDRPIVSCSEQLKGQSDNSRRTL